MINYFKKTKNEELCGIVVNGKFKPVKNIAKDKTKHFEINSALFAKYDIEAVCHSHCNNEPYLSARDRQSQITTLTKWILYTQGKLKEFKPIDLLIGREFEYGVNDCGVIIEDAYHLCGIDLGLNKRNDLDDDAKSGYVEDSLNRLGFYKVKLEDIQAGDVILTANNGVGNHMMLYLGDEEILHHLFNRLSRVEQFNDFYQNRVHAVYRHEKWENGMIEAVKNDIEAYKLWQE